LEGIRAGAWMDDGVVFEAPSKDSINLWKQPLSTGTSQVTGKPTQLTSVTGRLGSPSVGGSGTLAFSEIRGNDEIYSLPLNPESAKVNGPLERLTHSADFDGWPSVSPDGHTVIFLSDRLNHPEIWRKNLITGEEVPLTNDGARKAFPLLSADGGEISYYTYVPRFTAVR